ncbi:hypothetical protein FGO68_gene5217 [Halteria grandinella]|uniref:Uncharacterized protein n=1 Tax=Halteria grandinella TaxID=5974 RepID=A0A8J8NC30_HALGN|nr:hypothetical protein FGO68_gene5217 [Halteria grandinella]
MMVNVLNMPGICLKCCLLYASNNIIIICYKFSSIGHSGSTQSGISNILSRAVVLRFLRGNIVRGRLMDWFWIKSVGRNSWLGNNPWLGKLASELAKPSSSSQNFLNRRILRYSASDSLRSPRFGSPLA